MLSQNWQSSPDDGCGLLNAEEQCHGVAIAWSRAEALRCGGYGTAIPCGAALGQLRDSQPGRLCASEDGCGYRRTHPAGSSDGSGDGGRGRKHSAQGQPCRRWAAQVQCSECHVWRRGGGSCARTLTARECRRHRGRDHVHPCGRRRGRGVSDGGGACQIGKPPPQQPQHSGTRDARTGRGASGGSGGSGGARCCAAPLPLVFSYPYGSGGAGCCAGAKPA
jgi:hypothetical protein